MNLEKRALLAIVLSTAVLLLSQYFIRQFFPELSRRPPKQVAFEKKPLPAAIEEKQPERIKPVSLQEEKELSFETEEQKFVLSNIGGAVKTITLKKYFESADPAKPLLLAENIDPRTSIFALGGLEPELEGLPFRFEQKPSSILFFATTKSGLGVEREIVFGQNKYVLELRQTITNNSSQPRTLKYRITGGSGLTNLTKNDEPYIEVIRNLNGKIVPTNKKAIKNTTVWGNGQVDWVSFKNKYFSLVLKPPIAFNTVYSNRLSDNNLQTEIESAEFNIQPSSSVTHNFILYAGPNDFDIMRSLKLGFEDSLHLGFTGGIGRLLFTILSFFERIVKNWGIAILLLTITINVLLFPLTFKSLKSMKQMQALQPKIEALREAYKSNPQKLNKEIMELYRKYKINPLGGCLPILLQMPVFLALYQVLAKSIELRGAGFLWIKDLSQPDRLAKIPISLFEKGLDINILPILMAASMVVQQKLSTPSKTATKSSDQMAQQQKMMMVMMPIIFGVLFYNLPSGLVLYWFTNTILTIIEQSLFLKPHLFHVEHSQS